MFLDKTHRVPAISTGTVLAKRAFIKHRQRGLMSKPTSGCNRQTFPPCPLPSHPEPRGGLSAPRPQLLQPTCHLCVPAARAQDHHRPGLVLLEDSLHKCTLFHLRRKFLTSEDEHHGSASSPGSAVRIYTNGPLALLFCPRLHEWLTRRSHPMLADVHAAGLLNLLQRTPMEFREAKQARKMINSGSH